MEDDPQRPYSVLTRDEVKEKMKKQIDAISEVFLVSKSDATVLLMYLRWNSLRASERLSEDKDELLTESGLKSVVIDSNQDLSDSSCDEFYEFDDDVDDKISTPFCSHKFSTSYWSEYLEKNFFSLGKTQTAISCRDQDCRAAVGPDTIERLTVRDKDMYDGYVLRSYLEGIKKEMIKQCPASGCNYVVKFHQANDVEEYGLNVVCLCGHTFCWRCSLESHRPVTCNNASDWLSRDLKNLLEESDKSLSFSWIETNTKPCPLCLCPVELDGFNNFGQFLTCACSGRFCWKCMQLEESHKTEPGFFGFTCVEPEIPLGSSAQVENLCVDRWKECEVSMEEAKSDLRAFEKSIIKERSILTEEYIKIMREGLMLIVQCRQVLKWSCVYAYLHTEYEMSKKEYLLFLQEIASALVQSYSETLKEETEKDFTAATFEGLSCFRSKSSTATSNIGNYFYHFIKSLQDGLVDVKVRSYDNFAGPYWLCDRCTYGNTWLDMGCKMCFDATASPLEELSDLSSS